MKLAIFDLDNTLIAGDSDYLWGKFLCDHGYVDAEEYQAGHDRYYQDYLEGCLDIDEFLQFQLAPLAGRPLQQLHEWQQCYIETMIRPIILEQARALVEDHRRQGHTLLIITATNRFLTEPIAGILDIENLIATEPEFRDGHYTGKHTGIPSYREGKIQRLELWLNENGLNVEESWFYSDSHNDIPLLEQVDHATAVDPDEHLHQAAHKHGWPVISLRDNAET